MSAATDVPLLTQILEAVRTVEERIEGGGHDDPVLADAILWRVGVIAQSADRLTPELVARHPEVDWAGVRRLRLVADGALGGLTRDEVWRTVGAVLPRLREAAQREMAAHAAAPQGVRPIRTVLLVDDDPDIRRILDLLLTHAGFTVVEASDGLEALERVHATPVDAVVADVQMPRMDGLALVRQLRERPETRATPVLLFTGKPPSSELHGVLSMDRVRFMSKGDPSKVILALGEMSVGAA